MHRLQRVERLRVGLRVGRVAAARGKGHNDTVACGLRSLLDADVAGQHDDIGQRHAGLVRDGLQDGQDTGQALGFVAGPVLLRGQADAGAVGTAAQVRPAEGARAVPGRCHHIGHG